VSNGLGSGIAAAQACLYSVHRLPRLFPLSLPRVLCLAPLWRGRVQCMCYNNATGTKDAQCPSSLRSHLAICGSSRSQNELWQKPVVCLPNSIALDPSIVYVTVSIRCRSHSTSAAHSDLLSSEIRGALTSIRSEGVMRTLSCNSVLLAEFLTRCAMV
jgi:hypothetical protein